MRAGIIWFSAAAMLGSAALTAQAAEPGAAKLSPKAAAAVKKFRAEKGPKKILKTSGLKAAKDDRGLREPTAEEDAALRTTAVDSTSLVVNADGSLRAVLGEEHAADLVAVKGPDGTIRMSCGKHDHTPKAPAKAALETE